MPRLDQHALPVESGEDALGAFRRLALGDPGGLTQFGVAIETLMPGARSSERHWHSTEDELLYMTDGGAVLIEEDGEHPLSPGDVVCWPAGAENGHTVANRSDVPCSFLIVGWRAARGTCHYPDLDRTLYHDETGRRLIDNATGEILKQQLPG